MLELILFFCLCGIISELQKIRKILERKEDKNGLL